MVHCENRTSTNHIRMRKLLRRLKGKNEENLLTALAEASKEFPNDMEYGRCVRNFLFECTSAGEISESDMYKLMSVSMSSTRLKQIKP